MPIYENGKIYKIVDVGYNTCYIGSTVESLARRMAKHRNHYKNYQEGKKHRISCFEVFDEYGVENCKIELMEKYPCNSKEELYSREGHHIQITECINKRIAGRSKKQYIRQQGTLITTKKELPP